MKVIHYENILDPPLNLAMEEFALRHLDPSTDYLMLYVNTPSVIVGRNQNVYEEVNYRFIRKRNIPVYRRISGGGAVYHDPGNLNFSFITDYDSKRLNNYTEFNEPIIQALNALGIEAYMDDRNAIRTEHYKISGNAQFSAAGRMFSHGTLLFDADLDCLKRSLRSDITGIQSSAHKSVRSEIINIQELLDESLELSQFIERLKERISINQSQNLIPLQFGSDDWDKIRQIKKERYEQWDWNFGKSPTFTLKKRLPFHDGDIELHLEVRKGYINWISIESNFASGPLLHNIERQLLNTRFTPEELESNLNDGLSFINDEQFSQQFTSLLFYPSSC